VGDLIFTLYAQTSSHRTSVRNHYQFGELWWLKKGKPAAEKQSDALRELLTEEGRCSVRAFISKPCISQFPIIYCKRVNTDFYDAPE